LVLLSLLAGGQTCFGESDRLKWKKRWIVSVAVLAAAQFLDVRSSLGQPESNLLLRDSRGRFSAHKAIALKASVASGMLLIQAALVRHRAELYKPCSLVNFSAGGVVGGVAVRNWRLQARSQAAGISSGSEVQMMIWSSRPGM
jgi:hypothetical protein